MAIKKGGLDELLAGADGKDVLAKKTLAANAECGDGSSSDAGGS
jgi:hypothetical protein